MSKTANSPAKRFELFEAESRDLAALEADLQIWELISGSWNFLSGNKQKAEEGKLRVLWSEEEW